MRLAKPILYCSLSLAALSFAFGFWMLSTEAASTLHHASLAADALAEAPTLLAARVTALQASVEQLPNQVLPPVLARVDAVATKADAQLTALRTETLSAVKDSLTTADTRLASIQADLKPVLTNAASIEAHADKTVVDLHPQLLGAVAAFKVTMGESAQTMRTVRDTAPQIAAVAVSVGKSGVVIADSAAQEAKKFVAPMTRREKVMLWLQLIPRLALKIL